MMGAKTIYRPDIDGLRAIAILLVLFFHGGFRQLSGGFVGVDIFFVISGFLITGIILRETNTVGFSFVDFYSRRIRRICPALFLVLTLSIIAALFLLVPQDLQLLGRSLGAPYSSMRIGTSIIMSAISMGLPPKSHCSTHGLLP